MFQDSSNGSLNITQESPFLKSMGIARLGGGCKRFSGRFRHFFSTSKWAIFLGGVRTLARIVCAHFSSTGQCQKQATVTFHKSQNCIFETFPNCRKKADPMFQFPMSWRPSERENWDRKKCHFIKQREGVVQMLYGQYPLQTDHFSKGGFPYSFPQSAYMYYILHARQQKSPLGN